MLRTFPGHRATYTVSALLFFFIYVDTGTADNGQQNHNYNDIGYYRSHVHLHSFFPVYCLSFTEKKLSNNLL